MIQRIDAGPRMSEAVIHNGIVHLAGQVPETPDADIEIQTREVLAAIDDLLAQAGSDKTRILRAQIYSGRRRRFCRHEPRLGRMGRTRSAPARATVEARLANPAWKVEIVVTAAA